MIETFDCVSCGSVMNKTPDHTVMPCIHFCDECWQKMTPFERGLLFMLWEAGDRLIETLEEGCCAE